jgi:accessory gene regulator protein AgrB
LLNTRPLGFTSSASTPLFPGLLDFLSFVLSFVSRLISFFDMLYDCSESILLPISLFATKTKNKKKAKKVIHQKLNKKKKKRKEKKKEIHSNRSPLMGRRFDTRLANHRLF